MATPVRHKFLRPSEKFLLGVANKADVQRLREVLEKHAWQVTEASDEAMEGFSAVWVGPPSVGHLLADADFELDPPPANDGL